MGKAKKEKVRKMKDSGWKTVKIDYKCVKVSLWNYIQRVSLDGKPVESMDIDDILPFGITIKLIGGVIDYIMVGENCYTAIDLIAMGVDIINVRWESKHKKYLKDWW